MFAEFYVCPRCKKSVFEAWFDTKPYQYGNQVFKKNHGETTGPVHPDCPLLCLDDNVSLAFYACPECRADKSDAFVAELGAPSEYNEDEDDEDGVTYD